MMGCAMQGYPPSPKRILQGLYSYVAAIDAPHDLLEGGRPSELLKNVRQLMDDPAHQLEDGACCPVDVLHSGPCAVKGPGYHTVRCATRQPEKEHQDLSPPPPPPQSVRNPKLLHQMLHGPAGQPKVRSSVGLTVIVKGHDRNFYIGKAVET